MVKIMESPIKMDDLGGKPTIFRKHPYVEILLKFQFFKILASSQNGTLGMVTQFQLFYIYSPMGKENEKFFHRIYQKLPQLPPPKANMTFKNPPFEDVFPIEHAGFSNVILVFRGVSLNFNFWSPNPICPFYRGLFPSKIAGPSGVQVRRQSTGIWSWLRGWRCPEFGVVGWLEFGPVGVSKNRGKTPKWLFYNGNPIKMDDLGVTTIFGSIRMVDGSEIR